MASILVGLVGNLATNTVGEISAGWKPVIWTTLGLLAAGVTASVVRNALRSARDSASGAAARPDESAEHTSIPPESNVSRSPLIHRESSRRATPKHTAWQAKATLVVWALIAALGLVGTVQALTTPHFLDVGNTYISSFQLVPNVAGGREVTALAGIAIALAIGAWGIPPFLAGSLAYRAVPPSAGQTTRTLAACGAFASGGWSAFVGTLAGVAALRQLMSPSAAIYLTLIGVLALTSIAWGWAREAGLGPNA